MDNNNTGLKWVLIENNGTLIIEPIWNSKNWSAPIVAAAATLAELEEIASNWD